MQAIVYVFEVNMPPPVGFPLDAEDIADLADKCVRMLLKDGVREVNAFNVQNTAMLFTGHKSEKKPVVIYPRSKFPR
jgi:hypothetical protein